MTWHSCWKYLLKLYIKIWNEGITCHLWTIGHSIHAISTQCWCCQNSGGIWRIRINVGIVLANASKRIWNICKVKRGWSRHTIVTIWKIYILSRRAWKVIKKNIITRYPITIWNSKCCSASLKPSYSIGKTNSPIWALFLSHAQLSNQTLSSASWLRSITILSYSTITRIITISTNIWIKWLANSILAISSTKAFCLICKTYIARISCFLVWSKYIKSNSIKW